MTGRLLRLATAAALVAVAVACSGRPPTAPSPPDGPVDYATARQLVIDQVAPEWDVGTFCLDDRMVVENDELWVFEVGAREWLVDGDERFEVVGGVTVVYKADGRVGTMGSVEIATDDSIRITPNPDGDDPPC